MTDNVLPDVSRETMARLTTYADLLKKWNPKINLVSRATISELWTRHILDSKQIFELSPHPVDHWVDLGSGGGFPGMVVAILAMEAGSPRKITLVESDTRKCAFLRTVARETGAAVDVVNQRIELVENLQADVISARALADLSKLFGYSAPHLNPGGICLFPKGKSWGKELESAQCKWKFDYQIATSITEDGPVILSAEGVTSA